ncbi:hypothetical protein [Acinetobacter shaoyimingii]|uniref:Uncharacterized protein n=1 Tax=Acinetobacter shaoyimingii TaxID=2715164 RepID=A0A6G8RS84_9GAMM|nr:hypothetical protein [Acinetobacter shaoyimingii]QIO04829.1 hypothetical protein G8E00_02035 [Acinetobacter shaoyimingii]
MFDYYDLLHKHILKGLRSCGWEQGVKINDVRSLTKLGLFKNKISLHYVPEPSNSLMNWIFRDVVSGFNSEQLSIPIMLYFNEDTEDLDQKYFGNDVLFGDANELIKIYDQLESIEPLNFDFPFLILGFSIDQRKIRMKEIQLLNAIHSKGGFVRSITFQPEYYQAGLSILSYFATVLREKYPEKNATVKIEQQDFTVRMIVESENGDKEIIEKALHEYELLISGQTSIEDFYPTAIQTLELKNQIRMLNFQLESQKEIIALKNGEILNLRALAYQALSQPQPNITVINQLHNEQNINIDYKAEINQSYEVIDELIDLLSDESIKNQLRDIQNALDNTKDKKTPEEVKGSSGFKKLGKFLKEAKDTSSNIHGVLDNTDKVAGVIEKLTKHYDKLVQFVQPFFS